MPKCWIFIPSLWLLLKFYKQFSSSLFFVVGLLNRENYNINMKRTGGACGYGSLVDVKPLRARVGAVSPILFKNGEGCGACYKVRCLDNSICSRRAVTIIVTDECPGGYCSNGRTHFDLSGAAFGRMAIAGENGQLRDRGEIPVIYRRYNLISPRLRLSHWLTLSSLLSR